MKIMCLLKSLSTIFAILKVHNCISLSVLYTADESIDKFLFKFSGWIVGMAPVVPD